MSLAEGHVRSSVSHLSHPYLGGGTGLALGLSQIFKFLSNLPTSLPANPQSWARVIKRECIKASPHSLFPTEQPEWRFLISDSIIFLPYLKPFSNFPITLRIKPHPLAMVSNSAAESGHHPPFHLFFLRQLETSQLQASSPCRSWNHILPPGHFFQCH